MPAIAILPNAALSYARKAMIQGIEARKAAESRVKSGDALAKIRKTLSNHQKTIAMVNSFTLTYLATNTVTVMNEHDDATGEAMFSEMFKIQSRSNAFLNEKAIPRILTISRLLNGGTINRDDANEEFTACIIAALGEGLTDGAGIKERARQFMVRGTFGDVPHDSTWHSEGTQGSSSLKALIVCGVIGKSDSRSFYVRNKAKLDLCLNGINGNVWQGETRTLTLEDMPASIRAFAKAEEEAGNTDEKNDANALLLSAPVASAPASMYALPAPERLTLNDAEAELIAKMLASETEEEKEDRQEVTTLLALPAPEKEDMAEAAKGKTGVKAPRKARKPRAKKAETAK